MNVKINRIQYKDHRKETFEINKVFLPCFDVKMYLKKNGHERLAFGY